MTSIQDSPPVDTYMAACPDRAAIAWGGSGDSLRNGGDADGFPWRRNPWARKGGVMDRLQRFGVFTAMAMMVGIGLSSLMPRSDYDTDMAPPTGRETYAEVMPARIGGEHAQIQALLLEDGRYRGARAVYGDRASVEILQARTLHDLDEYVAQHVRPRLLVYSEHTADKTGSRWLLTGAANGRLHAWQNGTWLFVIEAQSDALFEEAVDQFAFIRRR